MSEKFPAGSRRGRAAGRGRHEQPAGAVPAARPGLPRDRAPRIQLPEAGRHPAPDAAPADRHRRLALTVPQKRLTPSPAEPGGRPPRAAGPQAAAAGSRKLPRPRARAAQPSRPGAPHRRPAAASCLPGRGSARRTAAPCSAGPHRRRRITRNRPARWPGIVFRAGKNAVLDVAAPAPGGAIDPLDADGPGKQARGRTTTS